MQNDINLNDSVVFITELKSPDIDANSTHIMATNLIHGMVDNHEKVVLFFIGHDERKAERTRRYFQSVVHYVSLLPSFYGAYRSKYDLIYNTCGGALSRKYRNHLKKYHFSGVPKAVIAHIPSLETAFWAKAMPFIHKSRYYQYWSDPLTLSGIMPDAYSIKRLPHKLIEKHIAREADRIIYGTRILLEFERVLFPELSYKMYYVDVSYTQCIGVKKDDTPSADTVRERFLYAGNYSPRIRNIQPLIDAVGNMPGVTLDVYGTGECDNPYENVRINGRVSPYELEKIERNYGVMVCVLNHSCIQIPGKIFYDINKNKKIIVVTDGKYKETLASYLETYQRFILCDNTPKSICEAIDKAQSTENFDWADDTFAPTAIARDLLEGGKVF